MGESQSADAEREALSLVRVVGHNGQPHHDAFPVGTVLFASAGKLPGDWDVHGAHHICEPLPPDALKQLRDRAVTAAAYRLSCSPHEWTDADSEATAQFTFAAIAEAATLTIRAERAEAEAARLREALEVPIVWSEMERDGMASAFRLADGKHGHYETLFAVASWLLRHRAALAAPGGEGR